MGAPSTIIEQKSFCRFTKLSLLIIMIVNSWLLYMGTPSTIIKQKGFVVSQSLVC